MPTANDEEIELAIPEHPVLEVVSVCVQPFNKCKHQILEGIPRVKTLGLLKTQPSDANTSTGSRRLLTYRKKFEAEIIHRERGEKEPIQTTNRATADDLNNFRKRVRKQPYLCIRMSTTPLTFPISTFKALSLQERIPLPKVQIL